MKILLAAAAALALSTSVPAASAPAEGEPDLAEIRALAERFRDVDVALAEGYIAAPGAMCETAAGMGLSPELGAMGIHYFRPDLLGITAPPHPRVDGNGTHTDFRRPAILIYEPQADGSLTLVAVENLVFEAAWRASGHDVPPSFHGLPYERMADDASTTIDEAHHFEPHFDRHVWLFRDNPAGIFSPFNANVSCEHARTQMAHSGHEVGRRESPPRRFPPINLTVGIPASAATERSHAEEQDAR